MHIGERTGVLVLSASLVAAALACNGEEGYRVLVRWDDDVLAMRSDRVELALIESCDAVSLGAPPPEQARRLEVVRGETPAAFGEVTPGPAGLYGRAFDEEACAMIAAACVPVVLEEGGGGTLEIVLAAIAEQGCPGGTVCESGNCVPQMGLPDGEAWIAATCFRDGSRCGDSLSGAIGTCYETGMAVLCCGGCYDDGSGRCEPGNTVDRCGWGGDECEDCLSGERCEARDIIRQCD